MEKNFADLFPFLGVEHDCILSRQGDITAAYQLILPEIFTLSARDYEALHESWIKAIRVLPNHTILHKQDWFLERSYKPDRSGEPKTFLAGSSDRFFNERPYLEHHCWLYITKKPDNRRLSSSLYSNLLRKSIVPEETLSQTWLREFLNKAGQFSRILEDSKAIIVRRLTVDEIVSNPEKAGVIENYYSLGHTENFQIGDISFKEEFRVGPNHCQLFTLADPQCLPSACATSLNYDRYATDKTPFSIGFTSSLGQLLPCNHIYNQYLFIGDAQKTLKDFESKRLKLQSLSAYSRENALSMAATHQFINEAIEEQRLPVRAHFNILAWTRDPGELNTIRNLVSSGIARLDATPKEETMGAAQIWWAGIPGNEADFPMNDCFDSFAETACCFLSLETHYYSSPSPFGIRLGDRLTGRPLHVDLDYEAKKKQLIGNFNTFILSGSGGGKSFFTNHLVRSYYEQGVHIFIVDVGHSYQVQCMLHKGYYFTYEEDRPITFNPFFLSEGDILDTEKKESIKNLLVALWKKSDDLYNRSEYVALSSALQLYYEWLEKNPGIFPCFNSFYDFLRTEFATVLETERVKEKDFDYSNFLYVLRPYYKGGEFDYLLNATENLDLLNKRFIVFELDNIKDHPILFPVVTLIIMEAFVAKMRKLIGVRKFIIIEEAWKAIAKEGMAEYIKYLFKTVRKFDGKAAVVTQEVEDIISSDIIKQAIINNSDCKILLDQSKFQNKFDQIQELLGITEKQKAEILSLNKAHEPGRNYKDLWIGLGPDHSRVYRLETSLEEYFVYTSDQREKVKVLEAIKNHGGDVKKGIRALIASMTLCLTTFFLPLQQTRAQIPIVGIIQEAIKKVVQAADLEIQRLQNQTIWLQDAQKQLENTLAESRLTDISDWVEKQRALYEEYYNELWQVKTIISDYSQLTRVVQLQAKIVSNWQSAYALAKQDKNFTGSELQYQYKIYTGIVEESLKNTDQVLLVVNSFTTQMSDEKRMAIIDQAAKNMEKNYNDLRQFNNQNIQLSLQRAAENNEVGSVKNLYGLP